MNPIKTLRTANGHTQQTLAEALGIERATVAMWETGRAYPTVDKLIRLADLLGVTTDELLGRGLPTPNDQTMRGGDPMNDNPITLNDLLALSDCRHLMLTASLTPRLKNTIFVDLTDSAERNDLIDLYGDRAVKSLDINGVRDALIVDLA